MWHHLVDLFPSAKKGPAAQIASYIAYFREKKYKHSSETTKPRYSLDIWASTKSVEIMALGPKMVCEQCFTPTL